MDPEIAGAGDESAGALKSLRGEVEDRGHLGPSGLVVCLVQRGEMKLNPGGAFTYFFCQPFLANTIPID